MISLKSLLKLFFEFFNFIPFLINSFLLILRYRSYKYRLIDLNVGDKKVIILGNGPSLKDDIAHISTDGVDFFCVNHFADSDYFEKFKPKFYLFLDPYFWEENVSAEYSSKRLRTFRSINEKVDWDFRVYIPSYASFNIENAFYNSNVKVVRYSGLGFKKYPKFLENLLLDTSIYSPYAINVVIHSVFIAIHSGYKFIDLYGVDTSVFLNLRVDPDSNQVYAEFEHFYGKSKVLQNEAGLRHKPLTLAECLEKEYYNFLTYELMARYARHREVILQNCSSFSLIDSIERKKTSNFYNDTDF